AITRLGEGLEWSGRLKREAMERTAGVVRRYLEICRRVGVEKMIAIGTSALREAENSGEFIERIEGMGLKVNVISGEAEAFLSFLSVAMDGSLKLEGRFAVVDVGGGSTEVMIGEGLRMDFHRSFGMGIVKLAERFLRSDPPTEGEMAEMMSFIDSIWEIEADGARALVSIGGTGTTLAAMKLRLDRFDPEKVHGVEFSYDEIRSILRRLSSLPSRERAGMPGMEPGREVVIVSGTAILESLMRRLGVDRMVVSSKGVRYGVAYFLSNRSILERSSLNLDLSAL
ncbi:Ppx/GppA family phosphatase, partial [Candidatus Poribacteria bacterium]